MICKYCEIDPMTNCCHFIAAALDFEYTCLNKKAGFKRCPLAGRPYMTMFMGVAKTNEQMAYTED